jgi:uncharacterized protein (TIGR00725 family)
MRSRAIIGVIGGGLQQNAAEALGREIVCAGHVLLTGGIREPSKAVTQAAQFGAASTLEVDGVVVRAVGILPSEQANWASSIGARDRSLYLSTGITHKQRDAINGVTPDVLVALKGGTGTLTEIAFARSAHRSVLLLNSGDHLKERWEAHSRSKGDAGLNDYFTQALLIYPQMSGRKLCAEELETDLHDFLETADDFLESDIKRVVSRAISLAGQSTLQEESGFPGVPPDYESTRIRFEHLLRVIMEDSVGEFCPIWSARQILYQWM